MKIVLSRKGFDSSAGGGPSPIVDGRALSLPIPDTQGISRTTYEQLDLGVHVELASRGRVQRHQRCHHDPMFIGEDGMAALGQCGAAQTHLERQGVGPGDVFLFFGLFRADGGAPHHRLFGYLVVEEVIGLDACDAKTVSRFAQIEHPHALGMHGANDCLWSGRGRANAPASDALRLTVPEGPPSLWQVPDWLADTGLTYHARPSRWMPDNRLQSVARGQEFVADIGERADARAWVDEIVTEIAR